MQFLAIGAAIYALGLVSGSDRSGLAEPGLQVVVNQRTVEHLDTQFEAVWRRMPTPEERERLIDEYVNEEILVREARALGLDQLDSGVRTRLRQLMEQILYGSLDEAPDEAALKAYLSRNAEHFRLPDRVAFEQILLGPELSEGAAQRALGLLLEGGDPAEIGTATVLPSSLRLSPSSAVDGVFGQGFFSQVARQDVGAWAGPVRSAYGQHLVRVLAYKPSRVPHLSEIRMQVTQQWIESERAKRREATLSQLRARYHIVRHDQD